jgi:hypothetical protein
VRAAFTERAVTSKQATKPILKRKVGYTDEEVSFTRSKLAQMKIGESVAEEGNEEENPQPQLD